MYKTIIVHVDTQPSMDARLKVAAWLAKAHDAHLVGSAATGLSWPAYALLTGSMAVSPVDEFDAIREAARRSLAHFAERARQLGVESIEERLVEDEHRDALLLHARYADLVVTSLEDGGQSAMRGLPQYLALHGARPVLAVPARHGGQAIGEIIVAAWDGSVTALRAISAALPLLARARAVHLALVNPERGGDLHGHEPGADMALYLARHGVPVEVNAVQTDRPAGTALLDIVAATGAGLLVAGAFGHSRYREIVLGGVTRVLLERATIPVLFAH
jgi:nucleotide-binding universal stress UspA family protein